MSGARFAARTGEASASTTPREKPSDDVGSVTHFDDRAEFTGGIMAVGGHFRRELDRRPSGHDEIQAAKRSAVGKTEGREDVAFGQQAKPLVDAAVPRPSAGERAAAIVEIGELVAVVRRMSVALAAVHGEIRAVLRAVPFEATMQRRHRAIPRGSEGRGRHARRPGERGHDLFDAVADSHEDGSLADRSGGGGIG